MKTKNKRGIGILLVAIILVIPLFAAFDVSGSKEAEAVSGGDEGDDIPILLKSRQFVPNPGIEVGLESRMSALAAEGLQRGHVLIQFNQLPTDSEREELKAIRVDLLAYIPENAWFAAVETDSLPEIQALPGVRWIGKIQAEDKIAPHIRDIGVGPWAVNPDGTVNLLVIVFDDVSAEEARTVIGKYGSVIEEPWLGNIWTVTISESDITALASEDAVQWIEEVAPPKETHNDGLRAAIGGNAVQAAPYNLGGSGVVIAEWDAGHAESTHSDLSPRVTYGDTATVHYHSTHVAGTAIGSGALSGGTLRGMVPQANLVSYEWPDDITETDSETRDAIVNHSAEISTNSWGYAIDNATRHNCYLHGYYDAESANYDDIVDLKLGYPITILFSAGNEENDGDCPPYPWDQVSGPGGTAKNTITVGATYSDTNGHACFSSRGPTDDGRIKPDVSAPGDQNGCLVRPMINSTWPGNTYDEIAGTSMSTPAVAGTAALLYQDYRTTHGGADPASATVKALLIHTARDLGNVGPDYTLGWGLINATAAVDVIRADNHPVQTIFLNQVNTGTLRTIEVYVAPGTSQLRATLVWTDEPGAVNAAVELVNNVDLNVTHGAATYLPWRLDPANPANVATTGVDNRNNVEQVVINSPASGIYTINVRGTSIPTGPQPYTLIVTGRSQLPANSITNIELTPPSPATVEFNEHVDITFDYSANEEGGVRIFLLPYTSGSPTSQYAVSGSPLYPVGTGSGSGYFTITSGEVTVDQVRFEMTNADQSEELLEFFVPVKYHFGTPNIWVKPPSFELMLPPNTNWSGKLIIGNSGDGTLIYNIVDVETTEGPYFQWVAQSPDPLPAGEIGLLKARVADPNGLADILYVKLWVTQHPGDTGLLYDDGTGGDEIAGDGIYTIQFYGVTIYGEEVGVILEAKDKANNTGQTSSTLHYSIPSGAPAVAATEGMLAFGSGEGITGTAEPSGAYSSTVEGTSSDDRTEAIEVTPAPSREPASAVARVALFEDTYPWGYTAIEDQLSAHGIPYTTYKSSDMGAVDLTPYTKVITASVQSDEFWSALAENKAWFENYVSNGGVLEMHLCAYTTGNAWGKVFPGGFVTAADLTNNVSIMYPDAPVVNMPNVITDSELDNWNYAAHGNFSTIPAGATVVLTATESGGPVYARAKLGKGSIIATTQTVEWRAGHGYPEFLENLILFMKPSGPACPWLDESPKTGSVNPSSSVEITITVNSNGLAAGKYSAELHILNNDLDEYPTIVPVQLTVKTPGVEGKVLFDETHKPSGGYPGNATIEEAYADWAQLLRTWGWTVESKTSGPITYEVLQNYCVVVIPEPTVDYTDTEVAAIKQYVQDGGGVLILGEWGSFAQGQGIFPVVNELAAPFGLSFMDDMVYDPLHSDAGVSHWPLIANFNRSVAGTDPDEVVEYGVCSIGTNGSAFPVAWTYSTAYTTAQEAAEAMVESSGASAGLKALEVPRAAPGGQVAPLGGAGKGQPTSSTGIDVAAESRVAMQDTEIQGSLAIAVIETWSNITDSVRKALNELGYTYVFYQTDNFSLIPGGLSPYDVVIVGADGGYIDQEPGVAALYSFLNGGGRVIFLGGSAYEPFVDGVDWYLMDVNTTNYFWEQVSGTPHLDIVDPTHPLASGLTDYTFTNLGATYYMLRITDPAIDIVAENGDGYPALITTGNLIWFINSPYQSYWTDPSDYNVLKTIIKNSLGLTTTVMAASFYGDGRAMVIGDGNLFDNSDYDSDGTRSLYEYDNEKLAVNIINWLCNLPTATYFDTGAGTYPSIAGTHNGTITPNADIAVSRLYTYPCEGTAGRTDYVKIWNESGPIAEAHRAGYEDDWHIITFNETVVLYATETYNYTIRTGSYPQIIHAPSKSVAGGIITCTSFVDVNGKRHEGWIPAITLY